ncbi:MAG: hypothetical protein GY764_12080 [Halieaceae bacterium]|nr:hypothetical protein [Halieaceae bacterium]MCP4842217.1 hypothetical protein [Halieaceae bacterium]
MSKSSRQPLAYRMPDGVEPHWVDERSGFLTGKGCPHAKLLPFIKGSQPGSRTDCGDVKKDTGIRDWFDTLFGGKE